MWLRHHVFPQLHDQGRGGRMRPPVRVDNTHIGPELVDRSFVSVRSGRSSGSRLALKVLLGARLDELHEVFEITKEL
jgi:hypothetical protein